MLYATYTLGAYLLLSEVSPKSLGDSKTPRIAQRNYKTGPGCSKVGIRYSLKKFQTSGYAIGFSDTLSPG